MTKTAEKAMMERPRSIEMDRLIGQKFSVLDHGHIVLMDYMGTDESIVQAARTSYQKGTKAVSTDKGLIKYLMRNRHTTPFEMCEIKLHVRMPIFVARQWIRHRTANVNEMSARYSILPALFYVPENEQCAVQSTTNRQGRGALLEREEAQAVRAKIMEQSAASYRLYEELLGMTTKDGEEVLIEGGHDLARELARMVLPTNFYTEWVWKIDLHNLFRFLGLRCDSHAQYEIRAYANIILDQIVKLWVPHAYEAFTQWDHHATNFSQEEYTMLCDVATFANASDFPWEQLGKSNNLTDKQLLEFKKKLSPMGDGFQDE